MIKHNENNAIVQGDIVKVIGGKEYMRHQVKQIKKGGWAVITSYRMFAEGVWQLFYTDQKFNVRTTALAKTEKE